MSHDTQHADDARDTWYRAARTAFRDIDGWADLSADTRDVLASVVYALLALPPEQRASFMGRFTRLMKRLQGDVGAVNE